MYIINPIFVLQIKNSALSILVWRVTMTFRDRDNRKSSLNPDIRLLESARRRENIEKGRIAWDYHRSRLEEEMKGLKRRRNEIALESLKMVGILLFAGYMAHVTVESYQVLNKIDPLPTMIPAEGWDKAVNIAHAVIIGFDGFVVAIGGFVYNSFRKKF